MMSEKRSKKAYGKSRADGMHGFWILDLGADMRTGAERQVDCGGQHLWTGSSGVSAGEPSQLKRIPSAGRIGVEALVRD